MTTLHCKGKLLATLVGCGMLMNLVGAHADGVWTNPEDPKLPPDFHIQGEYIGQAEGGDKFGCQVIALGGGAFQAVLYPGGLPGAGWDGKNRILMDGKRSDAETVFQAATGNKQYLAGPAANFSATQQFPPAGQTDATAVIRSDVMTGKLGDAKSFRLQRTVRKSPTLGEKPPTGAIVLFDGTNTEHWQGGRLDEATRLLNTDGHDLLSKQKFNNYTMHLEFMLPYRPEARGQGRGNSGFYQVDHYEVQILDSFGLEGLDNECGGIYSRARSLVNMCLPPLTWQAYDVDFTNAQRGADGKKTKNARITLKLNGVVIHDNLEIEGTTGGSRGEPEGTPGPIKLQGHGNPLQFRNIWIVQRP